jgi:hypothetical protein
LKKNEKNDEKNCFLSLEKGPINYPNKLVKVPQIGITKMKKILNDKISPTYSYRREGKRICSV